MISETQLRQIVKESTKEGVQHQLKICGFDVNNPQEVQLDLQHIRKSRELCELIQRRVVITGITLLLGGIFTGTAWAVKMGIFEIVKQVGG